jgi:hypothetical protein
MLPWLVVGVVLVVAVMLWARLASIRRATMAARLQMWLDPQYRDGRHVARRSTGRHASAGPQALDEADGAELIVHRRPLHIRRLAPATARRYEEEWTELEAAFPEDPNGAVHGADRLITMVMLDRGFPVDELERRAHELTARHGRVIANHRAAHAIALAAERTAVGVNELRRAMDHYAALFGLLVVHGGTAERRQVG